MSQPHLKSWGPIWILLTFSCAGPDKDLDSATNTTDDSDSTPPDDTSDSGNTGSPRETSLRSLADADTTFRGDQISGVIRFSHPNRYDLTGDGLPEMAVYELDYWNDDHQVVGLSTEVWKDGEFLVDENVVFEVPGDNQVYPVRDLDGDGYDDMFLYGRGDREEGTILRGPFSGVVDIETHASTTIAGPHDYPYIDLPLSSGVTGDLNGDGWLDLVHSEYENKRIWLSYGPFTEDRDLDEVGHLINYSGSHLYFPGTMAIPGDLNGDGREELVTQSESGGSAFSLYIFREPPQGEMEAEDADLVIQNDAESGRIPSSLLAEDLDGDGYLDLIVGAKYAQFDGPGSDQLGGAYIIFGPGPEDGEHSIQIAEARIMGLEHDADTGESISAAGDVDADGRADLWITAPHFGKIHGKLGQVYLMTGPFEGVNSIDEAAIRYSGVEALDWAGSRVIGDIDLNGDGELDVLVGAKYESTLAEKGGAIYAMYGPLL